MNAPNFKPDCCPACLYKVDSATPIGSHERCLPKPWDLSVCLNCGQLNQYNDQLKLVIVSPQEETDLPVEIFIQIRNAQSIIKNRGIIA